MTKSLLIAAAAMVAFASQAEAQAPAQTATQAPVAGEPQANLRGNWLQADQTRVQAQQRADMLFGRLDANHDGVVTRDEAQQAAAQMGGDGQAGVKGSGKRNAGRMVERLFSQADSVTQAQFQARALARFDRQDLNHDGTVTADERQQARAARQQQGN